MKKRIGMQYFAPSAIYWLISSIVLGAFLIFLSNIFTMYVLGFVELGILALSMVLSLMGMVLLDFLKNPNRYGYLFQAASYVLMAGLDQCTQLLQNHSAELFTAFKRKLTAFYEKSERTIFDNISSFEHLQSMKKI